MHIYVTCIKSVDLFTTDNGGMSSCVNVRILTEEDKPLTGDH